MELTHRMAVASSADSSRTCRRDLASGGDYERDIRDERRGPFDPGECSGTGHTPQHGAPVTEVASGDAAPAAPTQSAKGIPCPPPIELCPPWPPRANIIVSVCLPHAALIPIYWNRACPIRLPPPINPCVNASAHRFGGFGLSQRATALRAQRQLALQTPYDDHYDYTDLRERLKSRPPISEVEQELPYFWVEMRSVLR